MFAALSFVVARKGNILFRADYPPQSILLNPSGICALIEYKFHGGERGDWLDPFRLFLMLEGDAFYNVVDLRSMKIVRDSTTEIPAIRALSQGLVGMGDEVFYWNKNGKVAAFPGGDLFHEWTDINECEGPTAASEFANLRCASDIQNPVCEHVRGQLKRIKIW